MPSNKGLRLTPAAVIRPNRIMVLRRQDTGSHRRRITGVGAGIRHLHTAIMGVSTVAAMAVRRRAASRLRLLTRASTIQKRSVLIWLVLHHRSMGPGPALGPQRPTPE